MGTQNLHFTLGENAGELLVSIAREHLLYSLTPQKALETIQDSLIGCPVNIALDILIGRTILKTSDDRVSFNAIQYTPDMKDNHEPLDIEAWAERTLLSMKEDANEWDQVILELRNSVIKNDGKFDITVKYNDLIRAIYDGNTSNLFDNSEISDTIQSIKYTILGIRDFVSKCFKKIEVIKWLYNYYPGEIPDGFTVMPTEVKGLNLKLTDLMLKDDEVERYISQNRYRNDLVTRYIENERNIEKVISKGIQPVDITLNYSAGWLAPNGDYYALNGDIANMLHNQIATALWSAKVIPNVDDCKNNPDQWLCKNGWVKIHGDHILYDGYLQSRYMMPLVRITEEQRNKIALYGKSCHKGMLRFGLRFLPISVAKFEMMDSIMIGKIFDIDL